jgi:hypothetical protein
LQSGLKGVLHEQEERMQSAGGLGGLADVGSSGEDAERGCLEVWCRARVIGSSNTAAAAANHTDFWHLPSVP